MNYKGKKVFVTGAGGFIGSHLTEKLVEAGAQVKALVHYRSDGSEGWLARSPFRLEMEVFKGDIRDSESMAKYIKNVDVVFHLAALIGIPYSYEAPESYVSTNVTGTLNILQAVRRNEGTRMVHTSTSEVYGTALYVPIDEKHPLQGQSPYSATKIAADKLAESFYLSFNTPVVTIRPFNTFGPRQSMRAVIPTIINQVLKGKEITLGNLTPTRDLNYVGNTVEGFMRAGLNSQVIGKTINLGSDREISIGDLAKLIAKQMNLSLVIKKDLKRIRPVKSEVERLWASNKLAKKLLKWAPQTSLEDGLFKTIQWMDENQQYYKANVYAV
ncbi:MAG: SDR family NAD(P)-dependent oxidoreductase [Elusimicrobiota bacterium]